LMGEKQNRPGFKIRTPAQTSGEQKSLAGLGLERFFFLARQAIETNGPPAKSIFRWAYSDMALVAFDEINIEAMFWGVAPGMAV